MSTLCGKHRIYILAPYKSMQKTSLQETTFSHYSNPVTRLKIDGNTHIEPSASWISSQNYTGVDYTSLGAGDLSTMPATTAATSARRMPAAALLPSTAEGRAPLIKLPRTELRR